VNPHVTSTDDLFSFSHARNAARIEDARIDALRDVSVRARGLLATVKEQTEEDKLEDEAPGQAAHPRLGIGLPMSNIYAT
jgi:pyruvate dehydrogenase kinase 2/3/4